MLSYISCYVKSCQANERPPPARRVSSSREIKQQTAFSASYEPLPRATTDNLKPVDANIRIPNVRDEVKIMNPFQRTELKGNVTQSIRLRGIPWNRHRSQPFAIRPANAEMDERTMAPRCHPPKRN